MNYLPAAAPMFLFCFKINYKYFCHFPYKQNNNQLKLLKKQENIRIFFLHGVAASLRAIPMSQSSAPPPSVAPGPDFYFDLCEESEVCQFAILRTRPPEEAVLYGGPGAALALPSEEDPARVGRSRSERRKILFFQLISRKKYSLGKQLEINPHSRLCFAER